MNKPKPRPRNADATQKRILEAARQEFAQLGLGGARVDAIAARAKANKRMIYHYFGNKEQLFTAVLDAAYTDIRMAERALELEKLDPVDAIIRLVRFTWDYYLEHPEFLTFVNSENLHKARHLKHSVAIRALSRTFVGMMKTLLDRGARRRRVPARYRSRPAQHHHRGDRLLLPHQPLHRRRRLRARSHDQVGA